MPVGTGVRASALTGSMDGAGNPLDRLEEPGGAQRGVDATR